MGSLTLGNIISKIAPALGSIVSSVIPGSGLIIDGIAALFGADPKNESDIIAKINADPEAALKLIQFEKNHEAEIARLISQDRQSARSRDIELTKITGKRDWVLGTLTIMVTVGIFGVIFALLVWFPWPQVSGTVKTMIEEVISGWTLILGMHVGGKFK